MATSFPAAKYIISRYADPVFALSIGVAAAFIRIRREESEKRSGLPSSSMVITTKQQKQIDADYERLRMVKQRERSSQNSAMREEYEGPTTSDVAGRGHPVVDKVDVAYAEIAALAWERIKWKIDYEWNGRGKELERKDG